MDNLQSLEKRGRDKHLNDLDWGELPMLDDDFDDIEFEEIYSNRVEFEYE